MLKSKHPLLFVCLLLSGVAPLLAVVPKFWQVTSAEEFLSGEVEGIAITSKGELIPGPSVKKLASFTDPFVLSQARDGHGTRYYGTGNGGRVYSLTGSTLKTIYTAPEPEIYAVAHANGALFVGSSPNGKIYRLDSSGAATPFFDPKQAYIWDIEVLPDGDLVVATGIEGKLFRVDRSGKGTLVYDAPETHLRALAVVDAGRVLAGGSGEGRIYDIALSGSGRALFDSSLPEISAIYWDAATKKGWATGVTNYLPTSLPAKQDQKQGTSTTASSEQKDAAASPQSSTAVEISFGFDEGASLTPSGGSELYSISLDGFVETVRKFDREVAYAITGDKDGSVYIAMGPSGRVYNYRRGELALIANIPEKQVVSIDRAADAFEVTTTNAGAVYALSTQRGTRGEYRSPVKDTERFSTFGHYEAKGEALDGAQVYFRTGNTNTPDATWSDWHLAGSSQGEAKAPPARFVQWKLTFNEPKSATRVDSMSVSFLNRNVAPVIDAVNVLEPAAVIVGGAYPGNPQVLEATNPDEYGIFTSLDSPKDRNDPGKKMYRRGYRTITWKAHDDNGDALRHAVYFRGKGAADWLRLRENVEETQVNFDTSQLPDGNYEVRVVTTDTPDNPLMPLSDAREGTELVVDNTAPTIASSRGDGRIVVTINDHLSAIGKVEYSVDARKWTRLVPGDGIADSRSETFTIDAKETSGAFVVVRAVDTFYNVATANVQ